MQHNDALQRSIDALRRARRVVVFTGAGMSAVCFQKLE
jgi:NAD-dependent SIR2 family protein deacetylase